MKGSLITAETSSYQGENQIVEGQVTIKLKDNLGIYCTKDMSEVEDDK